VDVHTIKTFYYYYIVKITKEDNVMSKLLFTYQNKKVTKNVQDKQNTITASPNNLSWYLLYF